jgi:hypothetical protein
VRRGWRVVLVLLGVGVMLCGVVGVGVLVWCTLAITTQAQRGSQRREETSHIYISHPTSHIPHLTSHIPHPTSHIPHLTSTSQHHQCNNSLLATTFEVLSQKNIDEGACISFSPLSLVLVLLLSCCSSYVILSFSFHSLILISFSHFHFILSFSFHSLILISFSHSHTFHSLILMLSIILIPHHFHTTSLLLLFLTN